MAETDPFSSFGDSLLKSLGDTAGKVIGGVASRYGNELIYGESNAEALNKLAFERAYYNSLNGGGAASNAANIRSSSLTLNEYLFGRDAAPGKPAVKGQFTMIALIAVAVLVGILVLIRARR